MSSCDQNQRCFAVANGRQCLLVNRHDGPHCALGPQGWLWFGEFMCTRCGQTVDAANPVHCLADRAQTKGTP